jgi:hypothetical protein
MDARVPFPLTTKGLPGEVRAPPVMLRMRSSEDVGADSMAKTAPPAHAHKMNMKSANRMTETGPLSYAFAANSRVKIGL